MALPGHRRTSSDKRRRAAHFALTLGATTRCAKCDKIVRPHRACAFCGAYKGRQIINVDKRASRASRRTKKNK